MHDLVSIHVQKNYGDTNFGAYLCAIFTSTTLLLYCLPDHDRCPFCHPGSHQ